MQDKNISRVINTLSISDPTILDKNFKNKGKKVTRIISKFEIIEFNVDIILNQVGYRIKIDIKR